MQRLIAKACAALGDTVALYNNGAPIIGFYHSNSGGYTALPEQVWSKSLPYCREVLDPFSKKGSKAHGRKPILGKIGRSIGRASIIGRHPIGLHFSANFRIHGVRNGR